MLLMKSVRETLIFTRGLHIKKEVHFTIGDDKAYRIETDIENRTAECNFNNPNLAKATADFFDRLFVRDDAKDLDITKLFNDGN